MKSILATKLYIPPLQPKIILRPSLIEHLNDGLHRRLTLISASAGFGKTALVSEWINNCGRRAAWLSLDMEHREPVRFLTYLVAALQTIEVTAALQSPGPPAIESILTILLNDISIVKDPFILVLDDYHIIDEKAVNEALSFLVENLPPQMHLVIATREDPHLPTARLRGRGQLTEMRISDLRFSQSETSGFLKRMIGLELSTEDLTALDIRTEGWIAGLQLAAISMQVLKDPGSFIKSFTGSHSFVLDYLLEEVLQHQPVGIQTFLLNTSILDFLHGPLCDAVLIDPAVPGQETLEYLESSNMFTFPLDNERRWYRYHHLFSDLLRQRMQQREDIDFNELHRRASMWFEENA